MATVSQKSKVKSQKETTGAKLPKEIFNVKPNIALIHQVITGYLSNQKQSTAHTKTRGEVSGGGRKPWRQKGTGRARVGSIRSPLWIGGGIVFGPTPAKNYKKILPRRLRLGALAQVLADRYKNKKLSIVPSLKFEKPSTKKAIELVKKLGQEDKTLFVTAATNPNLYKSTRNAANLDTIEAQNLNALDVLNNQSVIIEQAAIEVLVKRFEP